MKKNMLAAIFAASLLAAAVTGYFGSRKMADGEVNAAEVEEYEPAKAGKSYYVIGISQFSDDPDMDICREAFIKELEKYDLIEYDNLSIRYLNASSSSSRASQISDSFVADGVDMIFALESDSVVSSYNSSRGTKVPVVFTASEDPFYEEADSDEALEDGTKESEDDSIYKGKIAGVIPKADAKSEITLIRNVLPRVRRIGILCMSDNEELYPVIEAYKDEAANNGIFVYSQMVDSESDIAEATAQLSSKVECILVPDDDTITENLETILTNASGAKVPVFGVTKEQVDMGCSAAVAIDYEKLGQKSAELVAKILQGEEDITEISTIDCTDSIIYANK